MVAQLDSRQRRVADFVAPQLRPDEFVDIVVPNVDERPSWFWAILAIVAVSPIRGASNSLVMTNQRLLVVRQTWNFWPKKIKWDWPLRSVRVFEYTQGTSQSYLCIYIPDGPTLQVTIGNLYDAEADELVTVLESTTGRAVVEPE